MARAVDADVVRGAEAAIVQADDDDVAFPPARCSLRFERRSRDRQERGKAARGDCTSTRAVRNGWLDPVAAPPRRPVTTKRMTMTPRRRMLAIDRASLVGRSRPSDGR